MANYCVVRTDRMMGTDVRSMLESVKYQVADTEGAMVDTAIENGNVVKVGSLISGEREVKSATTPAATTKLDEVVLVAAPEVMYDERKRNLDEYRNEAGQIVRGYHLHSGDIFSVTAEGLKNASPAVNQVIELAASTKWNNVATATQGSTVVGKIIAKEVVGRYTYYVIQVA